jgi:hypothetical protein
VAGKASPHRVGPSSQVPSCGHRPTVRPASVDGLQKSHRVAKASTRGALPSRVPVPAVLAGIPRDAMEVPLQSARAAEERHCASRSSTPCTVTRSSAPGPWQSEDKKEDEADRENEKGACFLTSARRDSERQMTSLWEIKGQGQYSY